MHTYKLNDFWNGAVLTVEAASDEKLNDWAMRELKHPARWNIIEKDGKPTVGFTEPEDEPDDPPAYGDAQREDAYVSHQADRSEWRDEP